MNENQVNKQLDDSKNQINNIIQSFPVSLNLEFAIRLARVFNFTDSIWRLLQVSTSIQEYDSRTPQEIADGSPTGGSLPESSRIKIRSIIDCLAEQIDSQVLLSLEEKNLHSLRFTEEDLKNPIGVLSNLIDLDQIIKNPLFLEKLYNFKSLGEIYYSQVYYLAKVQTEQPSLLRKSIFLTALSGIEPLLYDLLIALGRKKPNLFPDNNGQSLQRTIRDLMYGGGPSKWLEGIKKLGEHRLDRAIDWEALKLFWQKRNLFIHNNGKIDEFYYSKTKDSPAVGTTLTLETSDVEAAIDLVTGVRFALVLSLWDQINPGVAVGLACNSLPPLFDYMRGDRWRAAMHLTYTSEAFALNTDTQLVAKVNRWIALKKGVGLNSIKEEILAWNDSNLSPRFQMAKAVLLDNDDLAIVLIEDLIQLGELSYDDIVTFPLFDELRKKGKLNNFLKL